LAEQAEFILEMDGISKTYGENAVLRDVTIKVRPGEIHALLGENGAGKSTLMNVLFGMPVIHSTGGFGGTVKIGGEETRILSPMDAMNKGIGMVHQEFMLIPGFSVTDNIKLNREISRPWLGSRVFGKDLEFLDEKTMASDARRALDDVGMSIDEYTLVAGLPVGYMQFVEIAREIDKTGVKLLVFDEPTAVLTESEAAQLLKVMKQIASRGIAIIFITHRLEEVMEAADTITVLRDGQLVTTIANSETDAESLAALMIGRTGESMVEAGERKDPMSGDVAMRIRDLWVNMQGEACKGVNLDVMDGEILGIGGLAGQGKIGIPNGIMGLQEAEGEVELFGKKLALNNTREALKAGLAMVSEDRRNVGLLLDESIADNIAFSAMQIHGDFIRGPLRQKDTKKIRETAEQMRKDLDIRCTSVQQTAGTLSGGNQQKVCVARALVMNPKFLFVSEPTRGIDIGAKKLVLETLVKLNREKKMTIVMVSSELMELRSICDRIAIVSEGKVYDILRPDDSAAKYGLAMSGARRKEQEGGGMNE